MFGAKPLQWIRVQNHRSREILSDDRVKYFTTEDALPPPPYNLPPATNDIVPPVPWMDSCIRLRSSALMAFCFAAMRLPMVFRITVNRPVLCMLPQMYVKPRKSKVSGSPAPSRRRCSMSKSPELYQARLLRM